MVFKFTESIARNNGILDDVRMKPYRSAATGVRGGSRTILKGAVDKRGRL